MSETVGAATRAGVRRVLFLTLLLNLLVSGAKVLVGLLSGSLAMVADGFHSLLDGGNNVIGLIVTTLAYAPPDRGHPYGHRKFETAATLAIGASMLALAANVVSGAVGRVARPELPTINLLNWTVMAATLAVNLFVARYETREGRRLGSGYLVADAAHTSSDIYVTLGVAGSFVGAWLGFAWADPVVALGIGALIAVMAVKILLSAFHVLTDRAALSPEPIAAIVLGVTGVKTCRGIRTRGGPGAIYVDLTAVVDGETSLRHAHEIADQIEAALTRSLPEIADVVVHLEPAGEER